MTENFLVISVPYLPQCTESMPSAQFEALVRQLGPIGQALRHFVVPSLPIGTLDSLMEASDDLAKLDPLLENTVMKLISLMEETSSKPRSVVTTFRINQAQEMSPASYIKNFAWSSAQFDINDSITSIVEKFRQLNDSADERVRIMLGEYNETRNKLTAALRKNDGNLSSRPIRELVVLYNREHQCFVDTELLITAFVAVPVAMQKEWIESYWKLCEFVCPQSNRVVAEDKEYILNSVVLFRRVSEEFTAACRKKRYVVREVEGDDLSVAELQQLQQKAEKEKKALYVLLWQQYCMCYVAWMHVKAVRVFVESLLKYGPPPRFISFVVQLSPNKEAEIRKKISELYSAAFASFVQDTSSIDTGALQQEYPYVSLKILNVQK